MYKYKILIFSSIFLIVSCENTNDKKVFGQIVEIKADSISKSQDGEHWSLRFPRFKCFRGFDIKEKM